MWCRFSVVGSGFCQMPRGVDLRGPQTPVFDLLNTVIGRPLGDFFDNGQFPLFFDGPCWMRCNNNSQVQPLMENISQNLYLLRLQGPLTQKIDFAKIRIRDSHSLSLELGCPGVGRVP